MTAAQHTLTNNTASPSVVRKKMGEPVTQKQEDSSPKLQKSSLAAIQKKFSNGEDISSQFKKMSEDEQLQFLESMSSNASCKGRIDTLIKHVLSGPRGTDLLAKLISDSKGEGSTNLLKTLVSLSKSKLSFNERDGLMKVFQKVILDKKSSEELLSKLVSLIRQNNPDVLSDLLCNSDGTMTELSSKMCKEFPELSSLLKSVNGISNLRAHTHDNPTLGASNGHGSTTGNTAKPSTPMILIPKKSPSSAYLYGQAVLAFAMLNSKQSQASNHLQDVIKELSDLLQKVLSQISTAIQGKNAQLTTDEQSFDKAVSAAANQQTKDAQKSSGGFFGNLLEHLPVVGIVYEAVQGNWSTLRSGSFWKGQGEAIGIAAACCVGGAGLAAVGGALLGGAAEGAAAVASAASETGEAAATAADAADAAEAAATAADDAAAFSDGAGSSEDGIELQDTNIKGNAASKSSTSNATVGDDGVDGDVGDDGVDGEAAGVDADDVDADAAESDAAAADNNITELEQDATKLENKISTLRKTVGNTLKTVGNKMGGEGLIGGGFRNSLGRLVLRSLNPFTFGGIAGGTLTSFADNGATPDYNAQAKLTIDKNNASADMQKVNLEISDQQNRQSTVTGQLASNASLHQQYATAAATASQANVASMQTLIDSLKGYYQSVTS